MSSQTDNYMEQLISVHVSEHRTRAALIRDLKRAGVDLTATNPTHSLLGRPAYHEEYGNVVITSDHVTDSSRVGIAYVDHANTFDGTDNMLVPIWELTFPEETANPDDVDTGEAWLVDVRTADGIVRTNAIRLWGNAWLAGNFLEYDSEEIVLITPLVPAARREPVKPRTVTTEEEYEALPEGSIVSTNYYGTTYSKKESEVWWGTGSGAAYRNMALAGVTRTVLREGWGNE